MRRIYILVAIGLLALAMLACGDPLGSGPGYDTVANGWTCPAGQYIDTIDNGLPWCRIASNK